MFELITAVGCAFFAGTCVSDLIHGHRRGLNAVMLPAFAGTAAYAAYQLLPLLTK